jgi:hypothetical protein
MLRTKRLIDYDDSIIDLKNKEMERLSYEKQRLEDFISRLKTNNAEYDRVIKIAKETVTQVLDNKRLLLHAALGSVVEVLKDHPEKQLLIYDSLETTDYRIPSIPLGIDSQRYRQICMEDVKDLADEVYDRLLNNFVNSALYSASFSALQCQSKQHPP